MEITTHYYPKRKRRAKSKKPRTPSRQKLERELWRVFSLFIRQRDGRCVMGGMFPDCSGPIQAGHLIGRKKLPTKYHEGNVFGQCRKHNWLHNRNPERYTAWFISRFGQMEYLKLVAISKLPGKALSSPELLEKITYYKNILGGTL